MLWSLILSGAGATQCRRGLSVHLPRPLPLEQPRPADRPWRAASANSRKPFHLEGMASKLDGLWETTERLEMLTWC